MWRFIRIDPSTFPFAIGAVCAAMPEEITFVVQRTPDGHYLAQATGYPISVEGSTIEVLKESIAVEIETYFDPSDRPRSIWLHHYEDAGEKS